MRSLSRHPPRTSRTIGNVMKLPRKKRGKVPVVRHVSEGMLRIELIGKMRAVGSHGENILPKGAKVQALLGYLCLARGEWVLRSRIAGLIWENVTDRQARDSLRQALYEVDRAGRWPLETSQETVRLDVSACWIDAFEGPDRSDPLLDGLEVSRTFGHWLIGERTRFENYWQTVLEDKLNDFIANNAPPAERATAARKLRNFIPTHESAVRALMKAYVELGDRALAIREYERFRALAKTNLGAAPSETTVALYDDIRRNPRAKNARPSIGGQSDSDEAVASRDEIKLGGPDASNLEPEREFRPSIAVLPFENLSVKDGRDFFAEGLTDDLIEMLSRVPGLFVISRLSAAAFREQDRPPQEIGAALGVRYVLSGRIRMSGERLRLIVELTDANTGRALSVSPFDEKVSDLFELQQRLVEAVVRCVAPRVRSAELARMRIKRPEDQDAHDFLLRAQEAMNDPSRKVFQTAEVLFERASERKPLWASAFAWRTYFHVMRVGQGWSDDPAEDIRKAGEFSERAIACDAADPMALAVQGHVAAYLHKNFDLAFSCFERALRINPNGARAWLWNASALAWTGDGPQAIEKITRAMALSPYDPLACAYSVSACMAYLAAGQSDRAIEFALRSIGDNRGYTSPYKLLIVAYALEGREAEARGPIQQLLQLEPAFTVERFRHRFPGSAWPIGEICCDALARAGVPLRS
jgi:TolB-like protein